MLYLAIPAQNEVATIGVLLWRLRTVLAEFPREYEVVVYDDASSDETALVAEQYVHAMPVTVLRGTTPVGYAGAVDALVRYIAGQTRYPRRDAMMLLQGDFTDPPGIVPEFARRFEGGADLVVGERSAVADAPVPVKRLFSAAGWALKPFVRVDGIRDLTGSMRLMRISTLRDALRVAGDAPVCEGDSWTANADLLLRLVPHARKVESVPVEPTYGVRTRETRRVTVRDGLAALRWGWRARGRKATPTTAPESAADGATRSSRSSTAPRRRDEGELTAEQLRERSRDRDRLRGDSEAVIAGRDGRSERGRRDGKREDKREDKRERTREPKRDEARTEPRTEARREARTEPRAERKRDDGRGEKRDKREKRRDPAREPASAATAELDELAMTDPFAGRASARAAEGTPARVEPKALEADAPESSVDAAASVAPDVERPRPYAASEELAAETDDENDADDGAETAEDEAGAGSDARERKRRRNRRSRRRRSKNRGASEADASTEAVGASADSTDDRGTREADQANDRADDDGGDDAETDGDDSSDAGSAEDGADAAARSRSRRRGRRGRRGGSRRGRGRGNRGGEGGEGGDAESGGSDTGGGPPAGDPPPAE